MGVDKKLVELDVELDEFNKPKDSPTKTLFARVIKAARDAETQTTSELLKAQRLLAETQARLSEALERVRILENKIQKHNLAEEANRLDLTQVDRQRLIESASAV